METKHYTLFAIIVLITIFNLSLVYFALTYQKLPVPNFNQPVTVEPTKSLAMEKFQSENDFKDYIAQGDEINSYGVGFGGMGISQPVFERTSALDIGIDETAPMAAPSPAQVKSEVPERVSQTNVQVAGIDEPDIVKTDGQNIYYSSFSFYGPLIDVKTVEPQTISSEIAPDILPPVQRRGATKIISAFPPEKLGLTADILEQGQLLLTDNTLIIFSNDIIIAYDVSDPSNPDKVWQYELDSRTNASAIRLIDNNIYLQVNSWLNRNKPCPVIPLKQSNQDIVVECGEIYHPRVNINVQSTISLLKINAQTGEILDKNSYVGSSGSNVSYMSADNFYISYQIPGDIIKYVNGFFKENADLVPDWVITRLEKLQSYDISYNAKMTELNVIINEFVASINEDDALLLENEFKNRIEDYAKNHNRELVMSGLVKIDLNDFAKFKTGTIPGTLLNQFSLDEYDNHLRTATTIGQATYIPFIGSFGESENDIYVLDNDLNISDSIQGLGLDERIYSARFIADKGYLVTFKQTDPFYVLDLSNPNNIKMTGELKIPGYSSYLHPINKDKILGIGKEDNNVKISLFDVSNPANPQEIAKYSLNEYWSDILNTHHAFLLDDKFKVFFLPGSRGGYIFNYENNDLKLIKAVSNINPTRALFINDYLYVLSDQNIIVLNEKDWQEVNSFKF